MGISRDWGKIEISKRRTDDYQFTMYEEDGTTGVVMTATDEIRFKVYKTDGTVALDIDSVAATANGSIVTIDQITDPSKATVRFAQDDSETLSPGDYFAELLLVDDSELNPANAIKLVARGLVRVRHSASGDVGLS